MMLHLNQDDEGKTVVTNDGKEIGVIKSHKNGKTYVEPRELVSSTAKRKLNWNGDGPHLLRNTMVHSITEDVVRIRR